MNTTDQHHSTDSDSDTSALPPVVDAATWRAELDKLLIREKAHTHEGDAIAAARRRLPMVEIDANLQVMGANGPVTLLEVFEGRKLLIVYFQMWHTGQPAENQCIGCTFSTSHMHEFGYLNARDVTYATFAEGPYEESIRYHDFMGWEMPWYSVGDSPGALLVGGDFGSLVCYLRDGDRVYQTYQTTGRGNEIMAPTMALLDRTVYGRQETWEDSPEGWPQRVGTAQNNLFRTNGRPSSQWSRLAAGHSDDLGNKNALPNDGLIMP